jgi:chaperone required for assembly of F1-ATPase|tara:strand:+ start:252 stop:941 length:690 start_codon:yes stop_codon:yes gene_type:complete
MYLKPKLKCSDGVFNLFINNKEIKTPEKVSFNFKEKIFPNLILKEIKKFKLKNLNQSTYYNIFSLAKDKIQVDKQKYIEEVLKYINTDLICYWENKPDDLYTLQLDNWNSQLKKLKKEELNFDYTFNITPIKQNKSSIVLLKKKLIQLDDIILSCLLIITKITSSVLLSYLFITNRIKPIDLYNNTYLHEIWQSKKWGIVEEEKEKRENDVLIFKKIYKLIKIKYEKQN